MVLEKIFHRNGFKIKVKAEADEGTVNHDQIQVFVYRKSNSLYSKWCLQSSLLALPEEIKTAKQTLLNRLSRASQAF